MKIALTQGRYATVSPEDHEWLIYWKWHFEKLGYAARNARRADGSYTKVYMHRAILEHQGHTGFDHSDHINGVRLDNRRENLRPTTHAQNLHNTGPRRHNKSGVKHVCWHKRDRRWVAIIQRYGKTISLGRFKELKAADDAVKAYLQTNEPANALQMGNLRGPV